MAMAPPSAPSGASYTFNQFSNRHQQYELDSEAEDEVDELDPDSEQGEEDDISGSSKKSHSRRSGERTPGQSLITLDRMNDILVAEGSTGDLTMSKEAGFVLSIAAEEFVKRLARAGQDQANSQGRAIVSYKDMASVVSDSSELSFLEDTMPQPILLMDALRRREDKEKEILEDNPALSNIPATHTPIPVSLPKANENMKPPTTKAAKTTAATNGKQREKAKDKVNGNGSAPPSRRESRRRESQAKRSDAHTNGLAQAEGGESVSKSATGTRTSSRSRPEHHISGSISTLDVDHPSSASRPRELHVHRRSAGSPAHVGTGHDDVKSESGRPHVPLPFEIPWQGHFTGPASAFLPQDARAPFSRATQNPGRTIYSPRVDPGSLR